MDEDLALFGVEPQADYDGFRGCGADLAGGAALLLDTKAEAPCDPFLDMQAMLLEMTKELRERFAAIFRTKSRDEWAGVFAGTEACVSPVLALDELERHPHLQARESLLRIGGALQPAPAPRFSRTPGAVAGPPAARGDGGAEAEAEWLA